MTKQFQTVTIIGAGLIGGSLAGALKERCPELTVRIISRSQETLSSAKARGFADEAATPDSAEAAQWLSGTGSDLVFICTPVSESGHYFKVLADGDFQGIITDVASTKKVISDVADEYLKDGSRYIPGHPMAGSENNGFGGARANLFEGAYWILCPDDDTDDEGYTLLHELVTSVGARVISLRREFHDEAVAIVSHVPHMVASSLVAQASRHDDGRRGLLRLAAGGFKDSTRIAAGSPQLWTGIAMDNREPLANGLREFAEIIGEFESAIRSGDQARLTELLENAARVRRSLPAKWIPDSSKLVEMRINMTDHAGVIAEVTGYASKAGCNIQSINIDHISESTAVLDLVLTDEGDMGALCGKLISAGYNVSFFPVIPEE